MVTIRGNYSDIEKYGFYTESRILTKINDKTTFEPLSWEQMIDDFIKDATQYKKWRE